MVEGAIILLKGFASIAILARDMLVRVPVSAHVFLDMGATVTLKAPDFFELMPQRAFASLIHMPAIQAKFAFFFVLAFFNLALNAWQIGSLTLNMIPPRLNVNFF